VPRPLHVPARAASRALLLAAALAAPASGDARPSLLEAELRLRPRPSLAARQAQGERDAGEDARDAGEPGRRADDPDSARAEGAEPRPDGASPEESAPGDASSLDFDLLGEPPKPPAPADAHALRRRRAMLGAHQALGLGLVGVQLATTAVGQLSYSDRFHGGPSTGRYELTHKVLAYSTVGVFAVNGALALLAPSPGKAPRKLDRVMAHRIALFTAAAGIAAQAVLGIATRDREGYLDQERLATWHLAIGYATLAATGVGVGVLVL
jgi:hypothetical protein